MLPTRYYLLSGLKQVSGIKKAASAASAKCHSLGPACYCRNS